MTTPTLAHLAPNPTTRRHAAAVRLAGLELRLMLREPMVAIGVLAVPIVLVLVLAGVFGNTPDPDYAGLAPDDHYIVGYLGVVLASVGLITIPVHLASHRELGVIRRFRAAGLSSRTVVASQVAVGSVLAVASAAIVVAIGAAVYGLDRPDNPLAVAGWLAVGLACFVSIGVALGSTLRTSRAANAVGNLLYVPAFLLGGGGPPRSVMTGPMGAISDVLPLSHVIGGMRQAWLGRTDDPNAVWWPLLVTAACVVVAIRAQRRATSR